MTSQEVPLESREAFTTCGKWGCGAELYRQQDTGSHGMAWKEEIAKAACAVLPGRSEGLPQGHTPRPLASAP